MGVAILPGDIFVVTTGQRGPPGIWWGGVSGVGHQGCGSSTILQCTGHTHPPIFSPPTHPPPKERVLCPKCPQRWVWEKPASRFDVGTWRETELSNRKPEGLHTAVGSGNWRSVVKSGKRRLSSPQLTPTSRFLSNCMTYVLILAWKLAFIRICALGSLSVLTLGRLLIWPQLYHP